MAKNIYQVGSMALELECVGKILKYRLVTAL